MGTGNGGGLLLDSSRQLISRRSSSLDVGGGVDAVGTGREETHYGQTVRGVGGGGREGVHSEQTVRGVGGGGREGVHSEQTVSIEGRGGVDAVNDPDLLPSILYPVLFAHSMTPTPDT